MSMINEKDLKKIKVVVDNCVSNFIDNLPNRIDKILEGSICHILGLKKDSWNSTKFEIDHNRSMLRELVEKNVKQVFVDKLNDHVEAFVREFVDGDENGSLRGAIVKETRDLYNRNFRDALFRRVKLAAESDAEDFVDGLDLNALENVKFGPGNTDIDDPNSYDGSVGELFLKDKIRRVFSESDELN